MHQAPDRRIWEYAQKSGFDGDERQFAPSPLFTIMKPTPKHFGPGHQPDTHLNVTYQGRANYDANRKCHNQDPKQFNVIRF